jgi:hypothetical protein
LGGDAVAFVFVEIMVGAGADVVLIVMVVMRGGRRACGHPLGSREAVVAVMATEV